MCVLNYLHNEMNELADLKKKVMTKIQRQEINVDSIVQIYKFYGFSWSV